jgi:hypothetical protein
MIVEQNNCIYCGGHVELQKEHVIPASYLGHRSSDSDKQWIVVACSVCNRLAGSFVCFSIPEKAKFILKRYKVKFKKILSVPFWSDDELKELDYALRKTVEASIEAKALLNVQLKHLIEVSNYNTDYLRPYWVDLWIEEEIKKHKTIKNQIKYQKQKKKRLLVKKTTL